MSQDYADAVQAATNEDITVTISAIAAEIAKLGTQKVREPRVFKHEWVPLQRTNTETGAKEDALFWKIDGDVYVHPDRWDTFVEAMRAAGVEIR